MRFQIGMGGVQGNSRLGDLGHNHRPGAFIGEYFRKQRVAQRTVEDVGAFDAATQKIDDVLKLRDHSAGRDAVAHERLGFVCCKTRQL